MPDWMTSEERTLRRLYPTATKDELCDALPNHSWQAIKDRVSRLGIKRAKTKPPVDPASLHPIVQTLIQRRRELGLSQTELANQAEINRGNVCKVEHGGPIPGIKVLFRWCAALDLAIALQPINSMIADDLNGAEHDAAHDEARI